MGRLLALHMAARGHGSSWAWHTSEVLAHVGVHPALLPERAVVLEGERDRVGRGQKGRLGDGCHDLLEADWHGTRITHTHTHTHRITHHASMRTDLHQVGSRVGRMRDEA